MWERGEGGRGSVNKEGYKKGKKREERERMENGVTGKRKEGQTVNREEE